MPRPPWQRRPATEIRPARQLPLRGHRPHRQLPAVRHRLAGQRDAQERLSFQHDPALLDAAERERGILELVRAIDDGPIELSPATPFL